MNDATLKSYSEEITYDIEPKNSVQQERRQTEDQEQEIQTADEQGQMEEDNDDTYILTMTVDEEYLNSQDTIYPVTIDPTITWRGSSMVDDVYVKSGEKENINFYSDNTTSIPAGSSKSGVYRSYIHFKNLQEKMNSYTIASAKLILFEGESVAGKTIKAYRVNKAWNKSKITWKNKPGYDSDAISSLVSTGTSGKENKLTVTDYVRAVVKGTKPDYGILIRAVDEKDEKLARFYGSRSTKTTYSPKLSIVYYDKPSKASSISISPKYVKQGKSVVVKWEGINTPVLSNIQYKVASYDMDTKTVGDIVIPYSDSTYIGITSGGSKRIAESKKWKEGEYRIYVRGIDKYKSVGPGLGATFIIDGTAPLLKSAVSTINTSSGTYAKELPSIKWSGATDNYFDKVQYKVDDGKYQTLGMMESGTEKLAAAYFTKTGKYTIYVRAVDKAGNVSKEKNIEYYYDGTSPKLDVQITPGLRGNSKMPMLSWKVSDATLKKIQYSIDYGTYKDISTEKNGTYIVPIGQINQEKNYSIRLKAIDQAGNSATKELSYIYDISAPVIRGISVQPQTSKCSYTNETPVVTWFDEDDLNEVKCSVIYNNELKGTVTQECSEQMGVIYINDSFFHNSGKYDIEISLCDKAGNTTETTKSFYYDSVAPHITSASTCDVENNKIKMTLYGVEDDIQLIDNVVSYEIMNANTEEITQIEDLTHTGDMELNDTGDLEFWADNENGLSEDCAYDIYYAVRDKSNNYSEIKKTMYYYFPEVSYNGTLQFEGTYNSDTGIELKLDSDENISKASLFVAQDNGDFTKKAEFEENITTYDIAKVQENVTFRILVDKQDGTRELSKIIGFVKEEGEESLTEEGESIKGDVEEEEITGALPEMPAFSEGLVDQDEDGLYDCYEIWDFHTDELCGDTDADGLSDNYEIFMSISDPLIKDEWVDSDNDGLSNKEEYARESNPYLADTDFDGIRDNEDTDAIKTNIGSGCKIDYNVNIPNNYFDIVDGDMVYNTYWGYIKRDTDGYGKIKKYIYDDQGIIQSIITNKTENSERTIYTYDRENGNLLELVNNDSDYQFSYNDMGMIECKVGPCVLVKHQYTEDGQISSTQRGNSTKTYTYDECGNTINTIVDGVSAYEQEYDEAGLLTKTVDHINNQTYSYQYDEDEVECARKIGDKYSISTESDISEKDGGERTYNQNDIYQAEEESLEVNTTSVRNLNENRNDTQTGFSTGDIYCLNNDFNNNTITKTVISSNGKEIIHTSQMLGEKFTEVIQSDGSVCKYQYDNNNNLIAVYENKEIVLQYRYDTSDHLIRENNKKAGQTILYSYDTNGNIKDVKTVPYVEGNVFDEMQGGENTFQYAADWSCLLEKYNGNPISYDTAGHPLVYYNGMQFTWSDNKLTGVIQNQNNVQYCYNVDGKRSSKTVNGVKTEYLWDGEKLIYEEKGADHIWYLYNVDGEIIGFKQNDTVYYYEKDLLENVIGIYDAEKNLVVEYLYDARGNVLNISGNQKLAEKNPIHYRSYYYDNESGFYYLKARYYDPQTERFLNCDSLEDLSTELEDNINFNLFQYAAGNPVKYMDESGESSTIGFIAGGAIVFVLGIYAAVYMYQLSRIIKNFRKNWERTVNPVIKRTADAIARYVTKVAKQSYKNKAKIQADIMENKFSKIKSKRKYRSTRETHHIVEQNDSRDGMGDARVLMENIGISVERPENKIRLKTGVHKRLHIYFYRKSVSGAVISAINITKDRDEKRKNVFGVLQQIKVLLYSYNRYAPF